MDTLDTIKTWVKNNYNKHTTGWTYQRSKGNYDDCFSDGEDSSRSWCAYEIGEILGMELEEPEEPNYD